MRRLLSLGFLLAAVPLAAQDGIPWRASYYPYLIGNSSTGLMLVAHYQYARQADYDARVPFDGIFSAEAGASGQGSWLGTLRFRAPLLVKGWRFAADAGAVKEATFGYYGRGADGSNANFQPGGIYDDGFFQVRRTRLFVRGEATRRLVGPVQLALGAGVTHYRFVRRQESSLFNDDYFAAPLTGTDATARVSLIADARDNEFLPTMGALAEAGFYAGTGSYEQRNLVASQGGVPLPNGVYAYRPTGGYAGAYAHFRGYVSPRSGTVVAGRVAARALDNAAPLDAIYTLPGWENEIGVVGGPDSHRSFPAGRFAGRALFLTSLEVRHNLLDVGDYGAITLIAFMDAGRAFGENSIRWTLKGWQVGGGGGVALRVLRSALLTFNFAGGPDGFRFSMGKGWSF